MRISSIPCFYNVKISCVDLRFLFLLLCFFSSFASYSQLDYYGKSYKGIQAARLANERNVIVNKHHVVIAQLDTLTLDINSIFSKMEASSILDKDVLLIKKVIQLQRYDRDKFKELWYIARTYPALEEILMRSFYDSLLLTFGKRKLKGLLNKKE